MTAVVRQAQALDVEGLLVAATDDDARRFLGTVAQGSTKLDFNTIPYVLQLNKRDLPGVLSKEELAKHLQVKGEPITEGVAVTGQGVFETLREVAKLVLAELKKGG